MYGLPTCSTKKDEHGETLLQAWLGQNQAFDMDTKVDAGTSLVKLED